jgi:hypothetical protein
MRILYYEQYKKQNRSNNKQNITYTRKNYIIYVIKIDCLVFYYRLASQ